MTSEIGFGFIRLDLLLTCSVEHYPDLMTRGLDNQHDDVPAPRILLKAVFNAVGDEEDVARLDLAILSRKMGCARASGDVEHVVRIRVDVQRDLCLDDHLKLAATGRPFGDDVRCR